MKLKTIILKNFRSYKDEVRIPINDLTAFIGTNDIGKSTILEALEIFFNNTIVKIDSSDACVHGDKKDVRIGCVFENLPESITIDSTSTTNLKDEYLLNEEGYLEIHKIFDCTMKNPKEKVYAIANYPSVELANDLLLLKNTDLIKRIKELNIDEKTVDLRTNSSMRRAIYNKFDDLKLTRTEIQLNKEDAKIIWNKLKENLPIFALFQADRPSKDDDSEIQDPMKLAVIEAIRTVEEDLEKIKSIVEERVYDVANRTLSKLQEMAPSLAAELSPQFKNDPKWESLFKLTLTSDEQIPINKRGSGVRRLILLNFFRAEVERKQQIDNLPVIYAIEEPETSQHPSNQQMIINSLITLSEQKNCQVILTTHVPGLAGQLPLESLRFVKINEGQKQILMNNDEIYEEIANSLGVLPDINGIRALLFVEGTNDVNFLKHISRLLHSKDPSIPDLNSDNRIATVPLGGSSLKEWVKKRYLSGLGYPEIYIFDRDYERPKNLKAY
ncbi:MAG: ATP-binding protein [Bacillaceae bacterium]|nr:ATP-binding protein [Bacillaceae bacterium]